MAFHKDAGTCRDLEFTYPFIDHDRSHRNPSLAFAPDQLINFPASSHAGACVHYLVG